MWYSPMRQLVSFVTSALFSCVLQALQAFKKYFMVNKSSFNKPFFFEVFTVKRMYSFLWKCALVYALVFETVMSLFWLFLITCVGLVLLGLYSKFIMSPIFAMWMLIFLLAMDIWPSHEFNFCCTKHKCHISVNISFFKITC